MRYVIVGCGSVGLALAERWASEGNEVVGTTTRPERLDEIAAVCHRAVLLDAVDSAEVAATAGGADTVVLSIRPRLRNSTTRAARAKEYRTTLLGSALAVRSANRRVLFLSSTVVYGEGTTGPGTGEIDERLSPTVDLEPAGQGFAAAERVVLETPESTVLRVPDIYGHPLDPDYSAWLVLAHRLNDGVVPLAGQALCYRVDYRDVAVAAAHAVRRGLHGVYNVVPDAVVPRTYAEVFDGLADSAGLPRVKFQGEIKSPVRPVSSAKLRATGFQFTHSTPV